MTIPKLIKSSGTVFSPKRAAYLLDGVSLAFVLLLSFTSLAQVGHVAAYVVFGLLSLVLILCFFTPRSVDRWFPFLICLVIFTISAL